MRHNTSDLSTSDTILQSLIFWQHVRCISCAVLRTDCRVLMRLMVGGAAVSHRDLVSIIPYSSVTTTSEEDDKIIAHHDPRQPTPKTHSIAIADKHSLSPDRQDAIRMLIGYLESSVADKRDQFLCADDYQSSPGSVVPSCA